MYAPMLGSEPSSTGVHTSSLQLTGAGAAAAPLLPTVSSASLNGGGADDAIGLTRLPSASSEMSVGTDVSTPSSFGNRFSAAFAAAPIRSRLSRRGSTRLMMQRQKFTVDIRFTKLGLRLNTGDKRSVLSGVTGELRHGRVCAVMGPSGEKWCRPMQQDALVKLFPASIRFARTVHAAMQAPARRRS